MVTGCGWDAWISWLRATPSSHEGTTTNGHKEHKDTKSRCLDTRTRLGLTTTKGQARETSARVDVLARRQGVSINGYQPIAAIGQALPTPSAFYTWPISGSSAAFAALQAFAAVASAMSLEMPLSASDLRASR
jgi:hypothetical protein